MHVNYFKLHDLIKKKNKEKLFLRKSDLRNLILEHLFLAGD